MEINKNIFREYDIRGIYDSELNDELAYYIGISYGTKLQEFNKHETVLGYDNRLSSEPLAKRMLEGLLDSGINVKYLGLVTTPMCYFASDFLNTKASMMITASHNPKEYNGFKFSYNGIHNAYGESVYEIYDMIINKKYIKKEKGTYEKVDIKNDYIKLLLDRINLGNNKLKVIYDCGNGTTSIVANEVFSKLNANMIGICNDSDGTFPIHHPDPCVEENLALLKEKVLKEHADLGIGFDGDGDRLGVISEKGEFIPMDKYMIIMWRDLYNKVDNKKALFDVKCTKALEDELIKLGIEPTCYRTGNSYTKAKSYEGNYPLGGELSGHIYFRDKWPGYDDGIYAGLRLIELLSHSDKKLSELLNGINNYYSTPELKEKVLDNVKFTIVDKIKGYVINKGYKYIDIDGVRANFPDGWALVRASNTGPNITMRFEAKTKERLDEIQEEFTNILHKEMNELNN